MVDMEKIVSPSTLVGRTVTCKQCFQSHTIETYDKIVKGERLVPVFGIKHLYKAHIALPCGHKWIIVLKGEV